ncbi:hypothetical protein CABS02_14610 [Colletotrichum abscissum]|uniref:Uncharacterized protein n=1 Tax=Colletotrichum abscissum TaxID=1671311 RepID=A0A9P9X0W0_9PEZI|nr:hypothetical protein CABS02_14610 [Colletotrichum abscissum]
MTPKRSCTQTNGLPWHEYSGALAFNLAASLLHALYGTLSKLWAANIDSSLVVTTDVYTYIGVMTEVLNEGLLCAARVAIGDQSSRSLAQRLQLIHIHARSVQSVLGIAFVAGAETFAKNFVAVAAQDASIGSALLQIGLM